MLIEAAVVAFLAYWIFSEYVFNAYFHDYVDQLLGTRGTTFTAAIGLGIGLAGSAIAVTLYRNLQHARSRLETIAAPKIRGAVEKILSSLPAVEESQRASVARVTAPSAMTLSSLSQEQHPFRPYPRMNRGNPVIRNLRGSLRVVEQAPATALVPACSTLEEYQRRL